MRASKVRNALALFCALGLVCLTLGTAEAKERNAQLEAKVAAWAKANNIGWVTMAYGAQNAVVPTFWQVGTPPEAPILASLSKAITAVCVRELVHAGRLDWGDKLGPLLGVDLGGMTLIQAVTHSGGLVLDGTQRAHFLWFDDPTPRWSDILRIIELRNGPAGELSVHNYNNEYYGLLALVIERITGESYETACRRLVLIPARAFAPPPDPRMAHGLPWVGWTMSPASYLRFHQYWFGFRGLHAQGSDTLYFRYSGTQDGYGLGMEISDTAGNGRMIWHFGSLCLQGRLAGGALAFRAQGGDSVVLAWERCIGALEAHDDLLEVVAQSLR